VPVILTSAEAISQETDAQRLREFSRVQLLAKPFALDVLEEMVERLVAGGRAEREDLAAV
jgi:hypothetical protein